MFLNPDTWDLVVDDYGNIAMAESPYAIAQDVASACRLWLGPIRHDARHSIRNVFAGRIAATVFDYLMV